MCILSFLAANSFLPPPSPLLFGFVISLLQVRQSHQAFATLVRGVANAETAQTVAVALVDVFQQYRRNDRVSAPMLKAFDVLLSDGTLALLIDKSG